jgi:hypothetical protein
MKIEILFAIFLTLMLFVAGQAQSPDKAKLDQFLTVGPESTRRRVA